MVTKGLRERRSHCFALVSTHRDHRAPFPFALEPHWSMVSPEVRPVGHWRTCLRIVLMTGALLNQMTAGIEPIMDNNLGFNVRAYGAVGDGTADDTDAICAALHAAGVRGGRVIIPAGQYRTTGSLHVPPGVSVTGVAQAPQAIAPLNGTVLLATAGRGDEESPALFELGHSCSVSGITVFYPEQDVRNVVPYPWTFHLQGYDNTVENVTLINSYNGIRVGPQPNVRHRIRSVYGCVLRRGIFVDACTDIGRIDNVQFHCHWWSSPETHGAWDPVFEYMWRNCEAFIFGRTDWEYVNNTFVFPVNVGYRFIATANGAMNGQLSGIGADAAQRCMLVEQLQPMGLLVTNGQFVAFTGDNPIQVVIENTCTGSVRLVNCAFWGPSRQNVVSHSQGFVSLSDCYFGTWIKTDLPRPLIEADNGRLQIRGCSFSTSEPSIALHQGVIHAIVSDNNGIAGVSVCNEIGARAVLRDNEPPAP